MQSLSVVSSRAQTSAARRLARALVLESYFHRLWDEHHADEVRLQWEASQRMVKEAYQACFHGASQAAGGAG